MSLFGAPRVEAMPSLVNLFGGDSLNLTCRTVARDRPQDFLDYLKQAWSLQGPLVLRNPTALTDLQNISVLCEDGKTHPLCKTYLPLPKLKYLQSRYMLSSESFPFIKLNPGSVTDNDLGEWAFLKNDIGVGAESDCMFFVNMLLCVKRHNPHNVQFPRRLLELYLRIHAVYNTSETTARIQQQLRYMFEKEAIIYARCGWWKPDGCVLESPCRLASKTILIPVPDDWEASKLEVAELKDFYSSTMGIQKLTHSILLNQLETLSQTKTMTDTSKVDFANNFYKALDTIRKHDLSALEAEMLRSEFADHPRIAIMSGGNLTWATSTACVWSPHLVDPEFNDLSTQYPEVKSFWVEYLGVDEINVGTLYHELLSLPAGKQSIEKAKSLMVAMSEDILIFGDRLNKDTLLHSAVFPVLQLDGDVKLHSIETAFAIADKKHLRDAFAGKLELLDFNPTQIWQIENFLVWADIETRYLSWNVEERIAFEGARFADGPIATLIPSIAEGLVRIAVHFQSPRATTPSAKEALLHALKHARVSLAQNMRSILVYSEERKLVEVDSPLLGVSIQGSDQLMVYLPENPDKRQLCWATSLPRRLVEWLMTHPETESAELLNEQTVSLVKSILMPFQNRSPTFVKDVLDAEGVVDVETLTASPYTLHDGMPVLGEGPSQASTTSKDDAPSPGTNRRKILPLRRKV